MHYDLNVFIIRCNYKFSLFFFLLLLPLNQKTSHLCRHKCPVLSNDQSPHLEPRKAVRIGLPRQKQQTQSQQHHAFNYMTQITAQYPKQAVCFCVTSYISWLPIKTSILLHLVKLLAMNSDRTLDVCFSHPSFCQLQSKSDKLVRFARKSELHPSFWAKFKRSCIKY